MDEIMPVRVDLIVNGVETQRTNTFVHAVHTVWPFSMDIQLVILCNIRYWKVEKIGISLDIIQVGFGSCGFAFAVLVIHACKKDFALD